MRLPLATTGVAPNRHERTSGLIYGSIRSLVQGHDLARRSRAEPWSTGTDGVGDVARRQMSVVLLDQSRVGVAKVLRHHWQRCVPGDWPGEFRTKV